MICAAVLMVNGLMGQAYYPAKSMKPDTSAPGGFATSEFAAVANGAKTPKSVVSLALSEKGVRVTLENSSQSDLWFDAADSNIRGWLEAKVAGSWKPIQFHMWSTCGNSFHKVCLEPGYHWSYDVDLPKGDYTTTVRFAVAEPQPLGGGGRNPRGILRSQEIEVSLDQRIFTLPERYASDSHVTGEIPTLMPKRMGL